jgi:hypothetical protein
MKHDHLIPVASLVGAQVDAGPAARAEVGILYLLVELLLPQDFHFHCAFLRQNLKCRIRGGREKPKKEEIFFSR